jgi:hypothetical protein
MEPLRLTRATLIAHGINGLVLRFEVRRWAGDRSTGGPLGRSEPIPQDEDDPFHRVDLEPTGVVVDGGERLVLLATMIGADSSPNAMGMVGAWVDDRDPDGVICTSRAR